MRSAALTMQQNEQALQNQILHAEEGIVGTLIVDWGEGIRGVVSHFYMKQQSGSL